MTSSGREDEPSASRDRIGRAVKDAVRLLARRGHGRVELKTKLSARGHDQEAIRGAFERLAELGYLEGDPELARRYASELATKRGATPRFVLYKLRARGFDDKDADEAVADAFREWDPRVAALETVAGERDPKKVARRLTQKGFPTDAIAWVLARLSQVEASQEFSD